MNLFVRVKEEILIEDVVNHFASVELQKRGNKLVGLCPLHEEKTPSFMIYPYKNDFYCFGCGIGGDSIVFIEKLLNLSRLEAAKTLAETFNLLDNPRDNQKISKKATKIAAKRQAENSFKEACHKSFHLILNYKYELENQVINELIPTSKLVSEVTKLEGFLDVFLYGDESEKKELLNSKLVEKTFKEIEYEKKNCFKIPILKSRDKEVIFER